MMLCCLHDGFNGTVGLTRWAHRRLPRCFAPRNAKRYAKQRGALLWTNGTTRNTAYRITENGPVLRRPLDLFCSAVDMVVASRMHLRSSCPWRLLPKNVPPRSTVQHYFAAWLDDVLWIRFTQYLLMPAREAEGREASPSSGIIDSQSVKTNGKRRPTGLSRGQEGQGPQTPHPHRHRRPAGCRSGSRRQHPGSRQSSRGARVHPPRLPVAASCLRRRGLCLAPGLLRLWHGSVAGAWRSSNAKTVYDGSISCRAGGWSNAHWLG